jgi:hypothetical protein
MAVVAAVLTTHQQIHKPLAGMVVREVVVPVLVQVAQEIHHQQHLRKVILGVAGLMALVHLVAEVVAVRAVRAET